MAANETPYIITGIKVDSGQAPPLRKNFNTWSANYDQSISVSLFIRALQRWYSMDYDEMLSYFRISAIHGYPRNLGWNGVMSPGIFCSHNNITFPTWHRPYMLLFEQRIYELMLEVIDQLSFPASNEKQEWLDIALQWRLPYWDWALPSDKGHIPDLFTMDNVAIRQPLNTAGAAPTTLIVTNPLARYVLNTGSPKAPTAMGMLPKPYTVEDVIHEGWSKCAGTSRWGIKTDVNQSQWMLGINNWKGCNDAIDGHQHEKKGGPVNAMAISDLCYRILAPGYAQNWQTFATTEEDRKSLPSQDWLKYLSLEYIHNSLHSFVGGDIWTDGIGHMQNVPSAAFDPIFFMHHCNIDRLTAIYQTLYPKNWFLQSDKPPPSASLKPFYGSFPGDPIPKTRLFTSDDVSDWTKLGYQYDMLQRQPGDSQNKYIASIKAWVKSNYGGTASILVRDSEKLFKDVIIINHTYPDYIIDVIYDRYALDGDPYTILFYIGRISEEKILRRKTALTQDPSFVGSVYNFSSPMIGADGERVCENCDQQAATGSLSTGQIPLTRILYSHASNPNNAGLSQISPDQVETYLEKHLHWVILSANGKVVGIENLPETKVFVLKGSAQHYDNDHQPSQYGGYSEMPRATHNKPGGATDSKHPVYQVLNFRCSL